MQSWIPWKFFLRRSAQRRGFIDPVAFLARLRQFAQPSEVQEPIELIRAGVLFHARGLINTKVLQNNLDWIWPYWVERQFDPDDPSFLPRAFSFSHVNLTHRNWTAVGLPDAGVFPLVDPRGLVTPHFDGWSLDWWFIPADGPPLFPSRATAGEQRLEYARGLEVVTRIEDGGARLETRARVEPDEIPGRPPVLRISAIVQAAVEGRLFLAVRPANPEGVRFVDTIGVETTALRVNERSVVELSIAPREMFVSTYAGGDVARHLSVAAAAGDSVTCPAGLATGAAAFDVMAGKKREVSARIALRFDERHAPPVPITGLIRTGTGPDAAALWQTTLAGTPELVIPDPLWRSLHQASLRTLVLLSPDDVLPGPFTYRRFWFRDACLIMHALLALNLEARVERGLARFPARQRRDGYFHSQEGEWDANGEVLWMANRFERMTNRRLAPEIVRSLNDGARWIVRKRTAVRGERHTGLLPSGFSAEHLGPNDYYYWDDFWGVAGLQAAAELNARHGDLAAAEAAQREARAFAEDVRRSIDAIPAEVRREGLPASPYRRMDSGAIGSLVADYPLQLDSLATDFMARSADWLWHNCRHNGGFFQDMIHSGVNAYLTLALAQTFLRAGDPRYVGLIESIAALASPTGQWPEAVHPRTGGGCMGDGQHAWAAAEWALMIRALFLREEPAQLIVGSGLLTRWFEQTDQLVYGPSPTAWGPVSVAMNRDENGWSVVVTGRWFKAAPQIVVAVPGFVAFPAAVPHYEWRLRPAPGTPVDRVAHSQT